MQSSDCSSVHTGDDPVGNSSAVFIPRRAVLPAALTHVPRVSVHEQDDEVDHVVPGQEVAEACRGVGHGGQDTYRWYNSV